MSLRSAPSSSTQSNDPTRLMLAYLCISTEKAASLETKVEILDRFGLSASEIATVCGASVQSVSNARYFLKKHGVKSKKTK
jgi:hypothetical protein